MRALQKELDELRRDKERDSRRAREDEEELQILRERCERLEEERRSPASGVRLSLPPSLCVHLLIPLAKSRIQRSSISYERIWRDC